MAKQAGLGDNLFIAGYNVSGDVGQIREMGGGPAALINTAIDKSAVERIGGVRSGRLNFNAWFNDASNQEHDALSSLPTADVILTYLRGTTLGNPAAAMVAKQIGYDMTRGPDGALEFTIDALSNAYGIEMNGLSLTAGVRTDTGATNGSSVDLGAATANGLQAYLQALDFTGTDVTITVQESSDDGAGDAFGNVTGGGFTQITGSTPLTERIATSNSQAVERYLRVVTTTSGGFSDLDFVVVVFVNDSAVVF